MAGNLTEYECPKCHNSIMVNDGEKPICTCKCYVVTHREEFTTAVWARNKEEAYAKAECGLWECLNGLYPEFITVELEEEI